MDYSRHSSLPTVDPSVDIPTDVEIIKSGTLHKRGNYTWNSRFVALREDGTLTIANSATAKIKHILHIERGVSTVVKLERRPAVDHRGFSLKNCEWQGSSQPEPEHGLELAAPSWEVAREWVLALEERCGAICDDEIHTYFELSPQFLRALTPPRHLTRSASKFIATLHPNRYAEPYVSERTSSEEALEHACIALSRCLRDLTREGGFSVCSTSFLASQRGVRAIGRLLDAFALVLLGFNVLSLGQASFADTLLIYAACLLAVAATLEIGAQSGKDDGDQALGACLNDWLAAIGILCVLLVNTAVKGYFPADDWIALHLTASFLGLLVQIFVFVTLLTAMALGYEGDQMQARKEAAAERFTTPPPRVSARAATASYLSAADLKAQQSILGNIGKLAERAVNAAEKVTGVDLDGDGDVGKDGVQRISQVPYVENGAGALPPPPPVSVRSSSELL